MSKSHSTHPSPYITQQQAARIWGCTDRTVRNRISDGTLTGYRLPGSRAIRVRRDEVERLMVTMPAVTRARQPFAGGRIVAVAEVVDSAPDQQDESA